MNLCRYHIFREIIRFKDEERFKKILRHEIILDRLDDEIVIF